MTNPDYSSMYDKIFKIMGELTPLTVDCGVLCTVPVARVIHKPECDFFRTKKAVLT